MDRRGFFRTAGIAATVVTLPRWAQAADAETAIPFTPAPDNGWRVFEVVSRVELKEGGKAQVWLPLPSVDADDWARPMGNLWNGNASRVRIETDPEYGASMLHAEWDNEAKPVLEVVSRFATRDRAVDFAKPTHPTLADADRALYTKATELLPTDGIVADTASEIVHGLKGDEEKARAIYEWIVQNTVRDPKTRGCGTGDIRSMLETGNLGGKCADLNALYVGLARAAGLPARDVYGVRVADSRYGYKSLGKGGNISKGQHCRAEVWLAAYGWVPVDPADVRKVMLEEPPGNRSLDDDKVKAVHARLFGSWETNWLAYNYAHDLKLPGSTGPQIPYLMYPQGETAAGRLDSLDPAAFGYTLTSREITG